MAVFVEAVNGSKLGRANKSDSPKWLKVLV